MPNKTVTITEPVASDIQSITIFYGGDGYAASVEVSCAINTSDGEVSHSGYCQTLPADYSAASQTEMDAMAVVAAAEISKIKNFPTV